MLFNVFFVDFYGDNGIVVAARVKGDILQKIFHNGVKPPCSDILGSGVYILGHFGYFFNCVLGKVQVYVVDRKKRGVLRGYSVLGLG